MSGYPLPNFYTGRIGNTVQNATKRTEVHWVMFCRDTRRICWWAVMQTMQYNIHLTSCAGGCHNMPRPLQVDFWPFDLLTLKVVSESHVTWATSVPILVFLGLSVLDLGPMYATDRQTSDTHHRLMLPTYGRGHNKSWQNAASSQRKAIKYI